MSNIQLSGNITANNFKIHDGTLNFNHYDITTNNFWIGNGVELDKTGLSGSTITASSLLFWQGGLPYGSGNSNYNYTIDYQGDFGSGVVARYSMGHVDVSTNTDMIAWWSNDYCYNQGLQFVGITGEQWYTMNESGWYNLSDINYALFEPSVGLSYSHSNNSTIEFASVNSAVMEFGVSTSSDITFDINEHAYMIMNQSQEDTLEFDISSTYFVDVNPSSLQLFVHGYATDSQIVYLHTIGQGSIIGNSIDLIINPGRTGLYGSLDLYVRSDGIYNNAIPISFSLPCFVGPPNVPWQSLPMYVKTIEGYGSGTLNMYSKGSTISYSGLDLVLPSAFASNYSSLDMYMFGYDE